MKLILIFELGLSMKQIALLALLLIVAVGGCKKEVPVEQAADAVKSEPKAEVEQAVEPIANQEVAAEAEKAVEPVAEKVPETVELELKLPKPMFVGTPQNLAGIKNLEPDTKQARAAFMVPKGVGVISQNMPVTSSEMDPIMGSLDMVVDGDKEATEGSVVELGPFEQWVQIDLEDEREIYAVLLWHYHKTPRVYFDVVVQVSNDEEFITGVTTLFNNDIDNSLGKGVGTDMHYIDKAEGKLVDGKGIKGRYVRLYSQGNNQNDYSHVIEVEVFGK